MDGKKTSSVRKRNYQEIILDCMSEVVYMRDLDKNIVYVNPAAEKLTGRMLNEILGEKCYHIFGDKEKDCRDVCPVDRAIKEGRSILHHEGEIHVKEGERRKMRVSISPVWESGKVNGAIVVMQDVTDFKELQESHVKTMIQLEKEVAARKTSENRLRTLINAMPDTVCFKSPHGEWIESNPSCRNLLKREGIIYTSKEDIGIAKDNPQFQEVFQKFVVSDETVWQEGRIHREDICISFSDGEERVFDVIKVPIFDADGSRSALVVVGRDVTPQAKLRTSLELSEFHLKQAQSVAGIGSWHFDIVNDVLTWSEESYRIFGVEMGTPLNASMILAKIHPEDLEKVKDAWQKALEGLPFDIEHRLLLNDESMWVHEKAQIIFDDCGNPVKAIGTVHDITERKLLLLRRKQLNQLNERLLFPDTLENKVKIITQAIVDIFHAAFARIWIIRHGEQVNLNRSDSDRDDIAAHAFDWQKPLYLVACSACDTGILDEFEQDPIDMVFIDEIITHKKYQILVNDLKNNHKSKKAAWLQKHGLNAAAGFGIQSDTGELIGGLVLFTGHTISQETCVQLESFANITSQVVQTALKEIDLRNERNKLAEALSKIKTLSGMLPICSSCKKIRDDQGYWNQIESYIGKHSSAEFSHGICPDCADKLYPGLGLYDDDDD